MVAELRELYELRRWRSCRACCRSKTAIFLADLRLLQPEYWLCRSTDFPSSIARLAFMPGVGVASPDARQPVLSAGQSARMDRRRDGFWMKIQKRDGSFDEFYPNERGWAGADRFFALCDDRLLPVVGEAFPTGCATASWRLARRLVISWRAGTNRASWPTITHAVLPVFEAARLLNSRMLWDAIRTNLMNFYSTAIRRVVLEYDGADPGYLSATVSFLGKIYKHRDSVVRVKKRRRLLEVMKQAWISAPGLLSERTLRRNGRQPPDLAFLFPRF
jgi:ribosomal protein S18